MAAFEQKTIVRSYKLRIKNKYKSIVGETENVVTLLQSCVSSFKDEVDALVNNNNEKFFSLYENLDHEMEIYREKLFLLLASLEQNAEDEEIAQSEEKQNEASNSNLQQELVPCSNKNSSQTFCKTPFFSGASVVTSSTFCSVQEDFQSKLPEMQNSIEIAPEFNNWHNNFYHQAQDTSNTEPKFLQYSHDHPESYFSSESSTYQSLSSGVNATSLSNVTKNHLGSRCLETHESEKFDSFEQILDQNQKVKETARPTILNPLISVPSVIKAILSHIVSPYDFWMWIEESKELPSFETMEFGKQTSPLSVQPGDFCFALSNKVNMYYRGKVLTDTSVDEKVEVLLIDFGSIQSVPIKNLRILPEAAYQIPMRAFHCSLSDILPANGSWSAASIKRFKEYEGTCEVHVKSYSDGKYDILLMRETVMGFPMDVAEALCDEGFAVYKEEFSGSLPSSPLLTDKRSNQQVSHDSGVSFTSNQRISPCNQRLWFSSEMLHYNSSCISPEPLQTLQRKTYPQVELTDVELISFDSSEIIHREFLYRKDAEDEFAASRCLRTNDCDCPLHLLVQPPVVHVVEEGRMLVMLSNIVSPSEFYVNPAMEDSITLDELLEQMTAFYESHYQDYHIAVEDLKEGMFCAGRFCEDQSWYRIKILDVYSEDDNGMYAQVQYIDYGNKAVIKCSDLRPLKPEFIQHPCFALKCSLYGIVPLVNTIEGKFSPWDQIAVETFHQLANFDRCLTAEIVENSALPLSSETVQVLLWDTEEANDLLINEVLVLREVAAFHSSLDFHAQDRVVQQKKEEKILSDWDPMEEEYDGIENSYGVDVDDIGVAISGYRPKYENRVCKYFSLRNGYCPRGSNCRYEHVHLPEGGVTMDQEETYSLDLTPPLPPPSSHVFVQVSAVVNPGRFYAIFPFGNKTVEDIDSLCNQGSQPESLENKEVKDLFAGLNEYYSECPFTENTTVALSCGSIVVAWRRVDSAWHRARIIDVSDIAGPAQVFFVDFGDDSWVPRKRIREMMPQFLHTPFQAIECHLSDIEPLGFDKGNTWSIHSINYFKEVVSKAVLLAYITNRCEKILHLTLRNTRQNDHDFISQSLISAGFAQQCSLTISKGTITKQKKNYVPG